MEKEDLSMLRAPEFLGITLKTSEYIEWNLEQDSVRIYWGNLGVRRNASKDDILISVSRSFPNSNLKEVKDISNSIENVWNIKPGTGIIGINKDQEPERIGIIADYPIFEEKPMATVLTIDWIFNIDKEFRTPQIDLINVFGISILSKTQINKLRFNVELDLISIEDDQSAPVPDVSRPEYFFLNDKQPMHRFRDVDATIKVLSGNISEDPGGIVRLFYGTNRSLTGSDDWNDYYGDSLGELRLGTCEVSLPKKHSIGKIERPWSLWIFKFPESADKHVVIQSLEEHSENDFYKLLSESFGSIEKETGDKRTGLIYIHGYNNSFAEAARRTAQIAYDLPFKGLTGFFSWPSASKFKFYGSDLEYADESITDFEKFIRDFVSKTGVEQIHLIAHSMGNRILTSCMRDLKKDSTFGHELKKFHQIVLAAPDIDQKVFSRNILPHFTDVGIRRTIYASDMDVPLKVSGFLRNDRPRLGIGGKDIFVSNNIDSIDASNIKGSSFTNHAYMFESRTLLDDLRHLIDQNLEPFRRSLSERKNKYGLPYWLFPK